MLAQRRCCATTSPRCPAASIKNTAVLDLDYAEDSEAETDANFVMTGAGNIVEIQATAEKTPFSEEQFLALLALARKGIGKLVDLQKLAVT